MGRASRNVLMADWLLLLLLLFTLILLTAFSELISLNFFVVLTVSLDEIKLEEDGGAADDVLLKRDIFCCCCPIPLLLLFRWFPLFLFFSRRYEKLERLRLYNKVLSQLFNFPVYQV